MADTDQRDETYSESETAARAEATLRKMLATPHQKHKPLGTRPTREDKGTKRQKVVDRNG
jgi:hypothetical protein